ncbi:MAG: Crp/Fnr family transcriptional regulator [Myxococcota bacterium]|nr:Crp/Fnr family transcriptional regulator [Myxococcota bacterium]
MSMGNEADTRRTLRAIPLFSAVEDEDLDRIASHLIERRHPRGSTIVEEGLPGDSLYILRDGRVKVTKLSDDGREKILEMLGEGDFVGEMALLERAPRSASVQALTAVTVLALSRADFLGLLRKSPELSLSVIQELSRRLRSVNEQASALTFRRVKDRTRDLLIRLAKEEHENGTHRITAPLTHQQIADMVGTARETVTRVVKELKGEEWLRQEGKRYVLPAEDGV